MKSVSANGASHNFALWYQLVDSIDAEFSGEYTIRDSALAHRLGRVLRIKKDDTLILFGRRQYLYGVVRTAAEHPVLWCQRVVPIVPLQPQLTLYLPLLEKEAFEEAVRRATVLGVRTIYPLVTEKTKRKELSNHESDRLERIMIAAAEQSKQFCLPELLPVTTLSKVMINNLFWFDQHGKRLYTASSFSSAEPSALSLLIGPEGDFSPAEKEQLRQRGAHAYRLTATTLRSEDALMVALGVLRTYWISSETDCN